MSILPGCIRPFAVAAALLPILSDVGLGQSARPPLVGTVAPGAIGRPVQQPAPIGGIRPQPRDAQAEQASRVRGRPRGFRGIVPLRVIDAPLLRGGAIVIQDDRSTGARWFPSADRPAWRIDSTAARVDAWRDIIVDDVICTEPGTCLERSTRMRARWSAHCNCYLFADALNRIWRVE